MLNDFLNDELRRTGITPYALARKLHIEPQAVYQWTHGITLPCRRNRRRIAAILQLDKEGCDRLEYEYHIAKNGRKNEGRNKKPCYEHIIFDEPFERFKFL